MTPLTKPIRRVTRGALDGHHGRLRGRRLVATLDAGDILTLKPLGLRKGTETISLFDIYVYAIKCRVNLVRLEKARHVKSQKAEARQRRRSQRIMRTS